LVGLLAAAALIAALIKWLVAVLRGCGSKVAGYLMPSIDAGRAELVAGAQVAPEPVETTTNAVISSEIPCACESARAGTG